MPHSIFGWSYPPGCSGPPEPDEQPCDICWRSIEDCTCPECQTCGVQGCLEHLSDGELAGLWMQHTAQAAAMKRELSQRDIKSPLACGRCGKPISRSLCINEDPPSCGCGWPMAPEDPHFDEPELSSPQPEE